jgi:hypothetical protein
MADAWMTNAMGIALLAAAALVVAVLVRKAGVSPNAGAAMIGGALAGVLLGPTIFGRIAPASYEVMFIGGIEQREQMHRQQRRHQGEILAAIEAGASRETLEQLRHERSRAIEPLQRALDEARWEHQQPMRWAVAMVTGLLLFMGGMNRIAPGEAARSWASALSIGLWAAALPGVLTFLAMQWWGHDTASSTLVAAAVMIGPWAMTNIDRRIADQAEHGGAWMIQSAGRVATVIALAATAWAMWNALEADRLMWGLALLGLPCGWIAGHIAPAPAGRSARHSDGVGVLIERTTTNGTIENQHMLDDHPGRGPGYVFARQGLLPVLAACVAVRVELIEDFAFWPLLVLVILSGDGRWLGAVFGAIILGGRSGLRTMRLVLGTMACGPTQLAVLAIALHLWALPSGLPLALLAGAIIIEATTPARRKVAQQLIEAEIGLHIEDRDNDNDNDNDT